MAEIFPFRALRYNSKTIPDLAAVVTQPYDKITKEMQSRYYGLSPFNLVRIILGRREPEDTSPSSVYPRAARFLQDWIQGSILIPESQPALYLYDQEFMVPGRPGPRKRRRGFIALLRLADYAAGVVHRHEETLSGPKADRLELLKSTRAHFGQIFMLYSDPAGAIENQLAASAGDEPWENVEDEFGTRHIVRRVTGVSALEQVVGAIRDKKLVIADGHHRYETALAYRDLCRAGSLTDDRSEYVMVTLVRKESEGLTILPTHRLVHGLRHFNWGELPNAIAPFFTWEESGGATAADPKQQARDLEERLARAGCERPTLGAYGGAGKQALLGLRSDANLEVSLADVSPKLRRLDVVLLHRFVLELALGIDPQAVREQKNLRYIREITRAMEEVNTGVAQAAFLMNPTPIDEVWSNALAGRFLPQKSTDFYPKMLSGLTGYWLDNPAGV